MSIPGALPDHDRDTPDELQQKISRTEKLVAQYDGLMKAHPEQLDDKHRGKNTFRSTSFFMAVSFFDFTPSPKSDLIEANVDSTFTGLH